MKKILVIAAHPDDEVLGCAGLMARAKHEGNLVHVLICAEGLTARQTQRNVNEKSDEFKALYDSANKANLILGVDSLEFLNFPDNRMDSVELLEVVKKIEQKIANFAPDEIYTHFHSDVNIDHQIVNKAVLVATRPMPGKLISKVYMFEVPSSTDWIFSGASQAFVPNVFVDITNFIEIKKESMKLYEIEMRKYPHSRSIENLINLAKVRGATVGVEAAEAFMLVREII